MNNEMRDRLIKAFDEWGLNQYIPFHTEREMLAEYLIENGVIILPCKDRDTVYQIENNTDACRDDCPHFSSFYGMDEMCDLHGDIVMNPWVSDEPICDKQFYEIIERHPDIDWIFNHRKEFGKTIFLSRNQAEEALKEKTHETETEIL